MHSPVCKVADLDAARHYVIHDIQSPEKRTRCSFLSSSAMRSSVVPDYIHGSDARGVRLLLRRDPTRFAVQTSCLVVDVMSSSLHHSTASRFTCRRIYSSTFFLKFGERAVG